MWPVFNLAAEKDSMGYNSGVMIYVKRTFHPVGQGAFFTEQFYDETMDNTLYNVVYDDTSANEKTVWGRMEQIIDQCLKPDCRLTILQVPHHGSKYSYDEKLVNSDKYYAGFTNYDPYYWQRIFDDDLVM